MRLAVSLTPPASVRAAPRAMVALAAAVALRSAAAQVHAQATAGRGNTRRHGPPKRP